MFEEIPAGVVTGLAYTQSGGSILYIEVRKAKYDETKESDKATSSLKTTGNLAKVMEESTSIAYTVAKGVA